MERVWSLASTLYGETIVIAAAGTGRRLHKVAKPHGNKHLIRLHGRAALDHVFDTLAPPVCLAHVVVVTTAEAEQTVRTLVDEHPIARVGCTVIVQTGTPGTAAVLSTALDYIDTPLCCLYLGDNLFGWPRIPPPPHALVEGRVGATIHVRAQPDPVHAFASVSIVEREGQAYCVHIEEKSLHATGHVATGLYRFQTAILRDALLRLEPSPCGELEVTSLLRLLLRGGTLIGVEFVDVAWTDYGTPEGLAAAVELVRGLTP